MWRAKSVRLIIALLVAAPLLAACTDFDPEKLDFFHLNEKKKLPGERKPLFPEGVPGVSNGVPPDLVKGYQPPAQAADAVPAEQDKPAVADKPKPKLKPRVAKQAIPGPPATRITVQPAQKTQPGDQPPAQQQQQQDQAQSPWPAAQPAPQAQPNGAQSPWPSTTQQTSPWPAPPASGTFQR